MCGVRSEVVLTNILFELFVYCSELCETSASRFAAVLSFISSHGEMHWTMAGLCIFYTWITPSPPVDDIWAVMIVWRIRVKIIRTVLCCIVYWSCARSWTCSYEQFLSWDIGHVGFDLGLFKSDVKLHPCLMFMSRRCDGSHHHEWDLLWARSPICERHIRWQIWHSKLLMDGGPDLRRSCLDSQLLNMSYFQLFYCWLMRHSQHILCTRVLTAYQLNST